MAPHGPGPTTVEAGARRGSKPDMLLMGGDRVVAGTGSSPQVDSPAPMTGERYDTIGTGYRGVRVPDPRIAALIEEALGDAVSVVNVGAGTGSYESPHRKVVGVEPSAEMIRQRAPDAAPCIVGRSEALPFVDGAVDACTAFWTVHHWSDPAAGLREMKRVARRRVILMNYLPGAIAPEARWLSGVYFPHIARVDETLFPRLAAC